MKTYVIAGNAFQANDWIKSNIEKRISGGETTLSMSEYTYVSDQKQLFGIKDPHGVFVGTWRDRIDIYEIVQTLIWASVHVNPRLHDIHNSLKPKVKPTPKLSGSQITQAYVDEAAQLMAREIDAEVMKQFNGGDVTNRYNEVRKAMDSLSEQ